MEELTSYQFWQMERYGNILSEYKNIFHKDEDEVRQELPESNNESNRQYV